MSAQTDNKIAILIVDDIDINCDLLKFFLQGIATLDIANTGEDAVAKTSQNNYDLILLDISLGPGIDGFGVLTQVRSQPGNSNIPIIAVTGSATEFEKDDFLEKGFTDFLSKPISKGTLVNHHHQRWWL